MIIRETGLTGAYIIEPDLIQDDRGHFAELWTTALLDAHGLNSQFVQGNVSFNAARNTLRGLHYQVEPDAQAKLVCCTAGTIFDVGVDLNPASPSYRQWIGIELSASNHRMIYLSGDFAHGYQTLEDDSEILYLVTAGYAPQSERGIRWDDPAFAIDWPGTTERIMSDRDRGYPDFKL